MVKVYKKSNIVIRSKILYKSKNKIPKYPINPIWTNKKTVYMFLLTSLFLGYESKKLTPLNEKIGVLLWTMFLVLLKMIKNNLTVFL